MRCKEMISILQDAGGLRRMEVGRERRERCLPISVAEALHCETHDFILTLQMMYGPGGSVVELRVESRTAPEGNVSTR